MPLRAPTEEQIEAVAESLGLHVTDADIASYRGIVSAYASGFSALDALQDDAPRSRYPRPAAVRPGAEENPLNAWYVKARIEGAPEGKLKGRTVVLKDNVFLADVPMMNGTPILEGFVPSSDATIVERILDAGATIVGKSVCEAYCLSGGSHTSGTGPVLNPHDRRRSAGGSSSGSAALVAAGAVDMAIGCDQGGSIRMPSSFCGTYGMKPTHGLVPYTGILGMDPNIDHVGPITNSVADNAVFLEALAGVDGLDSRQCAPKVDEYTAALGQSVEGLRIGMLKEGFGGQNAEGDVDEKVRSAAGRLERLGAVLSEVSVPAHALAGLLTFGTIQSSLSTMLETDGCALGRLDPIATDYLRFHRRWRQRADDLPETVKTTLILAEYVRREAGYEYYARAVNEVRKLRAAYDDALRRVDLLLMPTTPMKATPLPPPDAPREVVLGAAFAPVANTSPFNSTHHPAMSIPCGMGEGLPIGLMLVGRHWEESTIYRAAHAFEQDEDWKSL